MTSNKKKTPPPPSSDFADAKAKKRFPIIGHIRHVIQYTVYTIFAAMWLMVSLLGCITIVDIALKTELTSITYHTFGYKELVALVALVLMWVPCLWVLKKALLKTSEYKTPQSPLSVSPQSNSTESKRESNSTESQHESNNAESQREQTIQHGISAIVCAVVAFSACIAIVSLAGENTVIEIQFPDLLTKNTDLIKWIALVVAILINIAVGPTIRQFFLKTLSGIWKLVRNLFGF